MEEVLMVVVGKNVVFFFFSVQPQLTSNVYMTGLSVILSYQMLGFFRRMAFEFIPTHMALKKKRKKSLKNHSREQNISHLRVFQIPPR